MKSYVNQNEAGKNCRTTLKLCAESCLQKNFHCFYFLSVAFIAVWKKYDKTFNSKHELLHLTLQFSGNIEMKGYLYKQICGNKMRFK